MGGLEAAISILHPDRTEGPEQTRGFHSLPRPAKAKLFGGSFLFQAPACDMILCRNLHRLLEDWAEAQTTVVPQAQDPSFVAGVAMRQRSKCLPTASKEESDACRLRKFFRLQLEGERMSLARAE